MATNLSTENKVSQTGASSSSIGQTNQGMQQAHRIASAGTATPTVRHQRSVQADPNKFSKDLDSIQRAIGRTAQDTYSLNESIVDEMISDDTAMMVSGLDEIDKSLSIGESRANAMATASSFRADLMTKKGDFGGNADMQERYRQKFVNPSASQTMAYMKKWQKEENVINAKKLRESNTERILNIMPLRTKGLYGEKLTEEKARVTSDFNEMMTEENNSGMFDMSRRRSELATSMTKNISTYLKDNYQTLTVPGDSGLLLANGKPNNILMAKIYNDNGYIFAEATEDEGGTYSVKNSGKDASVNKIMADAWDNLQKTAAAMVETKKNQNIQGWKAAQNASFSDDAANVYSPTNGFIMGSSTGLTFKEYKDQKAKPSAQAFGIVWNERLESEALAAFYKAKEIKANTVLYVDTGSGTRDTQILLEPGEKPDLSYVIDKAESMTTERNSDLDYSGTLYKKNYKETYNGLRDLTISMGYEWNEQSKVAMAKVAAKNSIKDNENVMSVSGTVNDTKTATGQHIPNSGAIIDGKVVYLKTGMYHGKNGFDSGFDAFSALDHYQTHMETAGEILGAEEQNKFVEDWLQAEVELGNIKQEDKVVMAYIASLFSDNKGEKHAILGIDGYNKGDWRDLGAKELQAAAAKLLKSEGKEMTPAIEKLLIDSFDKLRDDATQRQEKSKKLYWGERAWQKTYDASPPEIQKEMLTKARKNWYETYDEDPAKAMDEIRSSQNTFVVKAITDDIWEKIDNMGITSNAAFENYKKYKGALITADSVANLRNTKSGNMKYAMIIAYDQFEKKTAHMGKEAPKFELNQQAYDMTKIYVNNGFRGLSEKASTDSTSQQMLFELLDDNEFNEWTTQRSKYLSAEEQYEYKKDMSIAWIMSGGNLTSVKQAPNKQYSQIKSPDVEVHVANTPHMMDLMKGFSGKYAGEASQFQENIATKVSIQLRGENTSKHNAMVQSISKYGLVLKGTSKKGVYSIVIPEIGFSYDGSAGLPTGETIDLNNWDGSVPKGEHFMYRDRKSQNVGYNPLGRNIPTKVFHDLPTDKFKTGY